jgi:type III secretory pathway component EscT
LVFFDLIYHFLPSTAEATLQQCNQFLSFCLEINLPVKILLFKAQLVDILKNLKEKPDVATLLLVSPLVFLEAWM